MPIAVVHPPAPTFFHRQAGGGGAGGGGGINRDGGGQAVASKTTSKAPAKLMGSRRVEVVECGAFEWLDTPAPVYLLRSKDKPQEEAASSRYACLPSDQM